MLQFLGVYHPELSRYLDLYLGSCTNIGDTCGSRIFPACPSSLPCFGPVLTAPFVLIFSSIHLQCSRNTFVQGSRISFIGIFSQFGKIQKTEHAFVKKIKNPNLELPQTPCPAAKNFYIYYELEET